ncbi:hypothetical protein C8R47DRAFT_139386 [Mycena vitilis]|nr:hypothetical protein C8R47DRAFT_139386 [Mycena vitilis]
MADDTHKFCIVCLVSGFLVSYGVGEGKGARRQWEHQSRGQTHLSSSLTSFITYNEVDLVRSHRSRDSGNPLARVVHTDSICCPHPLNSVSGRKLNTSGEIPSTSSSCTCRTRRHSRRPWGLEW